MAWPEARAAYGAGDKQVRVEVLPTRLPFPWATCALGYTVTRGSEMKLAKQGWFPGVNPSRPNTHLSPGAPCIQPNPIQSNPILPPRTVRFGPTLNRSCRGQCLAGPSRSNGVL